MKKIIIFIFLCAIASFNCHAMQRTTVFISDEPAEYFVSHDRKDCPKEDIQKIEESNNKRQTRLSQKIKKELTPKKRSYWCMLKDALKTYDPQALKQLSHENNITEEDIEKECAEIKKELHTKVPNQKPFALPSAPFTQKKVLQ